MLFLFMVMSFIVVTQFATLNSFFFTTMTFFRLSRLWRLLWISTFWLIIILQTMINLMTTITWLYFQNLFNLFNSLMNGILILLIQFNVFHLGNILQITLHFLFKLFSLNLSVLQISLKIMSSENSRRCSHKVDHHFLKALWICNTRFWSVFTLNLYFITQGLKGH
jgi:hypothetical protein